METNKLINRKIRASVQRAVWRNGGSSPAETAVRIWKFVPRRKFSGSRHYAKPLGRCVQPRAKVAIKFDY